MQLGKRAAVYTKNLTRPARPVACRPLRLWLAGPVCVPGNHGQNRTGEDRQALRDSHGPDAARHPQIKGHGAKFDRKMEEAIAELLTHPTVDAAARAIDVAPTTLMRWLKDPEFDAAYRAARRAAFRQSIARLQQGSTAAATTLLKTMIDPSYTGIGSGAGRRRRIESRHEGYRDGRHRSALGRSGTRGRSLQGRTALTMHARLKRRVERLEERSGVCNKPRKVQRIVFTARNNQTGPAPTVSGPKGIR